MTKQIPLTQGKVALVDDDMYEELNKHKWCAVRGGRTHYAMRNIQTGDKRTSLFMHRQILGLSPGDEKEVDHKNRSGLDNRRINLRVVSREINRRNHGGHSNNISGHNGVCWDKTNKKWLARIGVNGKRVFLGCYSNIKDAIEARRQGELTYW